MGQYSNYKSLKFNKDRKFKIVQFTDIHIKEYNEDKRDEVLKIMTAVLKEERPELVVLTGDIASSENVEEA